MECFFINLESQPERRAQLERNFAQHKAKGWFLSRIQAADGARVREEGIQGITRDAEKGCFLSHHLAIRESLQAPGHVMILEDDAMLGPTSCAAVEKAVAGLPVGDWDLLFTDVSIYYLPLMVAMMQERRSLARGAGQTLMDLNDIAFAGSTAYVVNEASKERMLALTAQQTMDEPYDVFLRNRIRELKIRAKLTFPFATSVSDLADASAVQDADSDPDRLLLNGFRRLAWVDRDLDALEARIAQLPPASTDREAALFSRVLGATLTLYESR